MKKERLLKVILTIIMLVALLGMSINTFAATLDDTPVIDITNTVVNTNTSTNTGVNTNTGINVNTGTGNTYNTNINTNTGTNTTNLPNTGIAENTMFVVAVIALSIIAIYAYTKIKYYKNI